MVAIGNMMIKFQLLEPTEHARYSLHCNPSAGEGGRGQDKEVLGACWPVTLPSMVSSKPTR